VTWIVEGLLNLTMFLAKLCARLFPNQVHWQDAPKSIQSNPPSRFFKKCETKSKKT
jgi:hypothetical protein